MHEQVIVRVGGHPPICTPPYRIRNLCFLPTSLTSCSLSPSPHPRRQNPFSPPSPPSPALPPGLPVAGRARGRREGGRRAARERIWRRLRVRIRYKRRSGETTWHGERVSHVARGAGEPRVEGSCTQHGYCLLSSFTLAFPRFFPSPSSPPLSLLHSPQSPFPYPPSPSPSPSAHAALQVEGAVAEGGRGRSIWDDFAERAGGGEGGIETRGRREGMERGNGGRRG
ncbi:unnamed protein product [Closterium sp. NIES-53]